MFAQRLHDRIGAIPSFTKISIQLIKGAFIFMIGCSNAIDHMYTVLPVHVILGIAIGSAIILCMSDGYHKRTIS